MTRSGFHGESSRVELGRRIGRVVRKGKGGFRADGIGSADELSALVGV